MNDFHQDSLLTNELAHFKMLQALFDSGRLGQARACLSITAMPDDWNYALFVGLEPLLEQLELLKFTSQEIHYLASLELFSHDFLFWLSQFQFSGTVRAVPEGSVIFPEEPFVEISGSIEEVQLVAPFLQSRIRDQIIAATRAAQAKLAAHERPIFHTGHVGSLSQNHDHLIARAEFIGGFDITSTPLIARDLHLPLACLTPPAFLQCFGSELEAFRSFTRSYDHATLLVDHFDLNEGLSALSALAKEQQDSFRVRNIAISAAPLAKTALMARAKLDDLGFETIGIIAYGNLSNRYLAQLCKLDNCPIDGFALHDQEPSLHIQHGTSSSGQVTLSYNIDDFSGIHRHRGMAAKQIRGAAQIFRLEYKGQFRSDTIAGAFETCDGAPLLRSFMLQGYVEASVLPTIDQIKDHCASSLAKLNSKFTSSLPHTDPYPVLFGHEKKVEEHKPSAPMISTDSTLIEAHIKSSLDEDSSLATIQNDSNNAREHLLEAGFAQLARDQHLETSFSSQREEELSTTANQMTTVTKVISDVKDAVHITEATKEAKPKEQLTANSYLRKQRQRRVIPVYKRTNGGRGAGQ